MAYTKTKSTTSYIVHKKLKPQIQDSRVFNSGSIGSDHSLVLARYEILIKQKRKFYPKRVPKKFNVERLLTDPKYGLMSFKVNLWAFQELFLQCI